MDSGSNEQASLSEILDRAFSIYRNHFLVLILVAGLPNAVVETVRVLAGIPSPFAGTLRIQPNHMLDPTTLLIANLALGLISSVGGVLAWIGSSAAVWDILSGRTPSLRRAYGAVWRRFGTALAAGILFTVAIFGGMMLLIIPGILVAIYYSLTGPVIVAEQETAAGSLGRSKELSVGYRWRIFIAAIVCFVVASAIGFALQFPVDFLTAALYANVPHPYWLDVLSNFAGLIGEILAAPLLAIALCLIYYDARVRKEGFDLQRMLDALPPMAGAAAPQAPATG